MVLFFFSSRRRHTSLTCDWSSDVCSSDLVTPHFRGIHAAVVEQSHHLPLVGRSEERRVGKECRSRWLAKSFFRIALDDLLTHPLCSRTLFITGVGAQTDTRQTTHLLNT